MNRKVLGIIMAGGKGERLYPLTKERSKPAVPFGGKYRIADFVLSNFVNSGIFSIYVLVQYLSQSLIEYLRSSWRGSGLTRDQFITAVPPQMRLGEMWYRGTADAVRQNLNLIHDFNPEVVAIFGADHIYRMDINQMLKFHEENHADITVAAVPVPLREAKHFGILQVDSKNRVIGFEEKPKEPKPIPQDPSHTYASMGNYLFNSNTLLKALNIETQTDSEMDFGRSILPVIHKQCRVFAYDFPSQHLPGIKSYEDKAYWRDVGSIEAFWQSHMDLLGPRPKLDLTNPSWPIRSGLYDGPPLKASDAELKETITGEGCLLGKCLLERSILGRGVIIHDHCNIEESIIMDYTEIKPGTKLKRVIIDRYNVIPAQETIGLDLQTDSKRFYVDSSGIVVIPRGPSRL
ncbi:MAG: glucose-1-phosphate adenylyltransferase [Elusimicrobia bacterium]|nr:glucose-1-phosphate adenylyltransferase [Elusimicrobiota bacterium]